jgi:hypothetical protein
LKFIKKNDFFYVKLTISANIINNKINQFKMSGKTCGNRYYKDDNSPYGNVHFTTYMDRSALLRIQIFNFQQPDAICTIEVKFQSDDKNKREKIKKWVDFLVRSTNGQKISYGDTLILKNNILSEEEWLTENHWLSFTPIAYERVLQNSESS